MAQFTYVGDERHYTDPSMPEAARHPVVGQTYELDAAPDFRWEPVDTAATSNPEPEPSEAMPVIEPKLT